MSRKNGGAKYVKNFNGFTHLLTMLYAVIMRFDSLREIEVAMTAEVRKEREARLAAEKQDRYHNILNRFIAEGRAALRAFALSNRTNFNEKEAASIYYGIMAVAHKMELNLAQAVPLVLLQVLLLQQACTRILQDYCLVNLADYIEFLYTDEAEHQKDIERLWENRHKRLAK